MRSTQPSATPFGRLLACGLLAGAVLLCSCKPAQKADTDEADQLALWLDTVPQLKTLNVSNAEITELNKAHQAGLSDPSSVVLIQLARSRKQPFAEGQLVADLLNGNVAEQTVVELDRLNELGPWAGEARAIRLAGLPDTIILAVARRRSQGQSTLSGEKLGELKNTGVSDQTILEMVQKGDTDATATKFIAQRERAAEGHKFVYQTRAHR